eukprot:scaffold4150_cov117-Cylindrotheca_fusiformis.AAC.4
MNFEKYPWLADLSSPDAISAIERARISYQETGAVTFPDFVSSFALESCKRDALDQESTAYTTDDVHTAYLRPPINNKEEMPFTSVQNLEMRTQVASIAFDELPPNSVLGSIYQNPILRKLVSRIVGSEQKQEDSIYLSDDPLGCCSINVFRPGYHHSFHFDESEFSTTLMIQEAETPGTGLFQYTKPLRETSDDLALESVARTIATYDDTVDMTDLLESSATPPNTETTSSKSLHRVTKVEGGCSRCNSNNNAMNSLVSFNSVFLVVWA